MTFPIPPLKKVPGSTANRYPDRRGVKPEAVVLHIMQGSLAGCDSWFANSAAQAGAHFGVGKNGDIHQYFSLDQAPYANGVVEDGYTAQLVTDNAGINPNFWTVSIEHEGNSGDDVPLPQFQASTQLCAAIFSNYLFTSGATGVAIDRAHILRHGDISPKSRPHCPGWPDELHNRYIKRVQELLANPTPPPPPIDPRDVRIRTLEDALTVHERARRQDSAAALIQADTIAKLVKGG